MSSIRDTHKEIVAKLVHDAPSCLSADVKWRNVIFTNRRKFPYLETTGMPTRILLKSVVLKCYHYKLMVAETSIVKRIIKFLASSIKDCSKDFYDWDCTSAYPFSTSTVIRKLNDFHFKHDFRRLSDIMSWDVETVRKVTDNPRKTDELLLLKLWKTQYYHLFLRGKNTSYHQSHFAPLR